MAENQSEAALPIQPDGDAASPVNPDDRLALRVKIVPKAQTENIEMEMRLHQAGEEPDNSIGTLWRARVSPQEAVDLALRLLDEARAMHDAAAVWFAAMGTAKAELEAKGHFFTAPENAAHQADKADS